MKGPPDTLADAFRSARRALGHVLAFSFFVNVLMLTAPLYMLQIYDRVLVSRSHDTLLYLTLVAAGALLLMGLLESVRSRLLVRVGTRFDRMLASTLFAGVMEHNRSAQPLRDLDTVRSFFSGPPLLALLDAPWTPIYLACVYLLHPLLGHAALAGALVLLALALTNEFITREPLARSAAESLAGNQFAEAGARNTSAVLAMGMLGGLRQVWLKRHQAGIAYQAQASDRAGVIAALAKFVRFALQVGILGVGAWLAIQQIITPGVMIAASIIAARALAPVEGAINGWRGLVQARGAYARLAEVSAEVAPPRQTTPLPRPKGHLQLENVYAVPPGGEKPVLSAVSFELQPGTQLGITGPSAAGKSSLARLVTGVWQPVSGHVRLDGAELSTWDPAQRGPHVGFLPQEVELFPGTVAQNIARFGEVDADQLMAATQLAGVHEMILELPAGYDTPLGAHGVNLSGGQRQRIGLARAFYGRPALVVLDEPTSNLDAEGEARVCAALAELKRQGVTVLVVAHKPVLITSCDKLLVLQHGALSDFGDTAEVLPRITRPRPLAAAPGAVATIAGGAT